MTTPNSTGVVDAAGPNVHTAESARGRLLTAQQLAERWQVPKSQVYRLAREDRIPVVAIGRYYRFAPAAIEAFEQGHGASSDG